MCFSSLFQYSFFSINHLNHPWTSHTTIQHFLLFLSESVLNTLATASSGMLIGALPGQAPVVVVTPFVALSASRDSAADMQTKNVSRSIPGSTSESPVRWLERHLAPPLLLQ